MKYKRNDILFGLYDVFITIIINHDETIGVEKRIYDYLDANDYFDKRHAQDIKKEYVRVHGKTMNYWVRLYEKSTERTQIDKPTARKWAIWYHNNKHLLKTYTLD